MESVPAAGAAHRFSSTFAMILRALDNLDTSAMPRRGAASNYNHPRNMRQYATYVPSNQEAYPVYVDETAFIFVPDHDQTYYSFATMFRMILRALENLDTSAMPPPRGAASNYNHPRFRRQYASLDPLYQAAYPAPSAHDQTSYRFSAMFAMILRALENLDTSANPRGAASNYNSPMNMRQYASSGPYFQAAYPGPVENVDETAIILVPDHDQTPHSFSTMFRMILRALENLDTSANPRGAASNYNSSISPMNMRQYASYGPSFQAAYEDLIELQERIGHVNLGLPEKTISNNLKTSRIPAVKNQEEGEVCAVCQDEYKVDESIGSLECGHRYHATCIKQWLLHKNVCPVCKATALVL